MNKEYVTLENEIRAELMLRKTGERSEKYKHLADSEVLLLALAMTKRGQTVVMPRHYGEDFVYKFMKEFNKERN